jgi:hypothetical protein
MMAYYRMKIRIWTSSWVLDVFSPNCAIGRVQLYEINQENPGKLVFGKTSALADRNAI